MLTAQKRLISIISVGQRRGRP